MVKSFLTELLCQTGGILCSEPSWKLSNFKPQKLLWNYTYKQASYQLGPKI